MFPIFYPAEPLKGRDLLVVSGIVAVIMALITIGVLFSSNPEVAYIFATLTGLDLLVVVYAYFDMKKIEAKKQQKS